MMGNIKKSFIIGISGGSGAGKTSIAQKIVEGLGKHNITFIQHDWYYKDHLHLTEAERERFNYDHPDALETDLLVTHLEELIAGKETEVPNYDFTNHTRKQIGALKKPAPIIIVEGILIFAHEQLRQLMDLRLFVDADEDVRVIRRLKRDMEERGRSIDSVFNQYKNSVKPMFNRFISPSRRHAHFTISGESDSVTIKYLIAMIKSLTQNLSGDSIHENH